MIPSRIPGCGKCIALLLLILFLRFPTILWSSGENIGRVTRAQGDVICIRPGVAGVRKLKAGSVIQVADSLETGSDSRLQLLLSDDSVINISSGTVLRISQYSFDSGKNRRTAVVSLNKGVARFILHQERKEGNFRIETGQALIQAAIADLAVEIDGQQTGICTLFGNVGVSNSSNLIVGNIRVGENSCTMVREKNPPSTPTLISPQQRRRYVKDANRF